MEDTAYMEVITSERALMLTQEQATAGNSTISMETGQRPEGNLYDWMGSHPALALKLIRKLPPLDQDLLLSVYVLSKSQIALASIFELTQSNVAQLVIEARKRLAQVCMGQKPKQRKVRSNMRKQGDVYISLPRETGQFRVDVTAPGFASLFTARAAFDQRVWVSVESWG